jgi:hypothetical protein
MVRRWRADLSQAAAIDGRMGRNSIHRKSNSKRDASTRLFYRCAQNGAGVPCERCSHGSAIAISPPQR